MTTNLSPTFAAALAAHISAYAVHDAFAEAGDDGVQLGGSPEADAASEEEYRTLDVMMTTPGVTPDDILAKIDKYLSRELYSWDGPKNPIAYQTYAHALIADVQAFNRPTPSPAIAAAFDVWAAAWKAMDDAQYVQDEGEGCDHLPKGVTDAASAAEDALIDTPYLVPADFMVKSYIELLGELGGYSDGFPFLIKLWDDLDQRGDRNGALLRDLSETDLGRCMQALGRTDFDADAWIAAAITIGHEFSLIVDSEGRVFWQGEGLPADASPTNERHLRLLSALISETPDHRERTKAICDRLSEAHPDKVTLLQSAAA